MNYFKAYWYQVRALYKMMWQLTFTRDRTLEGPLSEFVPKPGLFWALLQAHWFLAVAVFRILAAVLSIVTGYISFLLVLIFFFILPVVLFFVFPVFVARKYREIRHRGAVL